MILAFFSLIILLYSIALLVGAKIWGKLPLIVESGELKSVTILIPFRNEAENLNLLLHSLSEIEYPVELLEVILINDHSEDHYRNVIESNKGGLRFKMTVLSLPAKLAGKKSAISAGVKHSRSEIILTSDADCSFGKDWVQKMQAPFEVEEIQLVSGSVVFKAHNLISRIFQMEFAPLIGVGAISIDLGNPVMANGANLAFRKSIFVELNPYADNISIPSGDDVFLLQKVKGENPSAVFFQKEAVVESQPPEDFKSFYSQRVRWAAKWRATSNLVDTLPALMVWSFHLIYLTAIVYSLITNEFLILLPVILLKIVSEGIFISLIFRSQGGTFKAWAFVILQLVYSFYVMIFGLLANFGSYTWKERKYNTNERSRS